MANPIIIKTAANSPLLKLDKFPPWLTIAEDGVPEYFMDHTLLSTFRMCEERFMLDYVYNYRAKGFGDSGMPWPLRFGILIHDCMEELYKRLMAKWDLDKLGDIDSGEVERVPFFWSTDDLKSWLEFAAKLWREGNLDAYSNLPAFKTMGGFNGFLAILTAYNEHYAKNYDKNNLRCVALEIGFGRNKEVPILENSRLYKFAPFRVYLAGRLDYIFDDNHKLGPLDHKTFSQVGKNPLTTYEVQEGMTGYCYAMAHLYKKIRSQLHAPENYVRQTNTVWMNFICTAQNVDLMHRFQRIPLYKTEYQLEEWRQRQISTVAKIHSVLFDGRKPDWNTQVCTNYWHGTCTYQSVHRLNSERDQFTILNSQFTQGEAWNPERVK